MCVGLHICRGNFKGGLHFSEGGYDRIATQIFQQIKRVNVYYLEYGETVPYSMRNDD